MMVGDNVYHRDIATGEWIQEDSHHSNQDGSTNMTNFLRDTKTDNVLISNHFFYFGSAAPPVDLESISYKNGMGYSKKTQENSKVAALVEGIEESNWQYRNIVIADPIQFEQAEKREAKSLLVMGRKVPRWPECHFPEWAEDLDEKEQQQKVLDLMKEVVLRYRDSEAIQYWQVENEPFFFFANPGYHVYGKPALFKCHYLERNKPYGATHAIALLENINPEPREIFYFEREIELQVFLELFYLFLVQ